MQTRAHSDTYRCLGLLACMSACSGHAPSEGGVATGTAPLPASDGGGSPYGAGLTRPFLVPDTPWGRRIDATQAPYGATANDPRDDDGPAIARAIAAASPGDEVVLPAGTFHIKSRRSIKLPTGVSLRGAGSNATVVDANFANVKGNANSILVDVPAGTRNVTISDLALTTSGGQELNYALSIGDAAGAVTSRVAVRRLDIRRFTKMAVSVRNGQHVLVENCTILDAAAEGSGGEGYGVMIGYDASMDNWIVGNTMGPKIRHAVLLQYRAHNNLVERNVARQTTYDSYDLHGEDEYANELRFNSATDCGEGGIGIGNTGGTPEHMNAGPNNWIHHNTVRRCRFGIHIYRGSDQQYVEDNEFGENEDIGITIQENGGAKNVVFRRNRVIGNGAGVRFENAAGLEMYDNIVTGNATYALELDAESNRYRIVNNDFRNNGDGVELETSDGTYEGNQE